MARSPCRACREVELDVVRLTGDLSLSTSAVEPAVVWPGIAQPAGCILPPVSWCASARIAARCFNGVSRRSASSRIASTPSICASTIMPANKGERTAAKNFARDPLVSPVVVVLLWTSSRQRDDVAVMVI
ncbi:hypothetical protein D9M68_818240 [compost metagenome]